MDLSNVPLEEMAALGGAAMIWPSEDELKFSHPAYRAATSITAFKILADDFENARDRISRDKRLSDAGQAEALVELAAKTRADAEKLAGNPLGLAKRELAEAEREIRVGKVEHSALELAMVPMILAKLAPLDALALEIELRTALERDDTLTVAVAMQAPRSILPGMTSELADTMRELVTGRADPEGTAKRARWRTLIAAAEQRRGWLLDKLDAAAPVGDELARLTAAIAAQQNPRGPRRGDGKPRAAA